MNECGFTLGAAFLAGLAGLGHCGTMCGGLAAAIGRAAAPEASSIWRRALTFNVSRLASYTTLGALLGAGLSGIVPGIASTTLMRCAHVLSTIVLVGMAIRLLFNRDLLAATKLGDAIWKGLRPLFVRATRLPPTIRLLALGSLWG